jgi:arylsulfatase A-like enzyme
MKKLNVLFFGLCLCAQVACTSKPVEPIESFPNIILLMGDDHSWEETGYNGHPFLKTPILDQMAASGLRMDEFHAAAPFCSPTRGSVLTGRHPNRYGTFTPGRSIRPEEVSIASILANAGYLTGHFGKWHLGPVKKSSPTNPGGLGFHTWVSHDNFFEMNPHLSRDGGPPVQFQGEGSEIIADETIRFIERAQQQNQPFFAVVWFGSPHEPYSGLDRDLSLYDDLPDSLDEQTVRLTSMETGNPVDRSLRAVLRERFAEITAMDRAIGKLRKHLISQGIRKNTVLWYCGDNGIPSSGVYNNPFRGRKGFVYQGGLKVPSIIEWPQEIANVRPTGINAVTSDILPTLCDIIGQPLPDRPLDGISLLPLIRGELEERPTPIFFWNYETSHETASNREPYIDPQLQVGTTPLVKMMNGLYTRNFRNFHHSQIVDEDFEGPRAILDNRFKLIIDGNADTPGKALYDLKQDPREQHNLLAAYPAVADSLGQQLYQWQRSVLQSLTGADYR